MGVFRVAEESCYGEAVRGKEEMMRGEKGPGDWDKLIHSGGSWVVE
jgi:hypothetical protein